jgi:hypothetical protein
VAKRLVGPNDSAVVLPSAPRGAGGYRQAAGVHLRDVDGDLFLVRPRQDGVFHLDPIAAALWRMLSRPTTMAVATGMLCEAFPGVGRARIARDVKKTFDALRRGGLIDYDKPVRNRHTGGADAGGSRRSRSRS